MGRREQMTVGELTLTFGLKRAYDQIISNFLKIYAPAAAPLAAVAARYLASTPMANGAYTLINGGLPGDGLAHNVTVTHTTVATGTDTLGTITIIGEDVNGKVISEVITPLADQAVQGTKAFKKVTSMTQAGWAIAGGNDTITIGFGILIGIPDMIAASGDIVLVAMGTALINAPTVSVNQTNVAQNTVTATGANGTLQLKVLYQLPG